MTQAATKERPILFSGPMVRAILDGRKTQTRRVMKPQPNPEWGATSAGVMSSHTKHDGEWSWLSGDPKDCDTWCVHGESFRCPFGEPGDRLWVRETWGAGVRPCPRDGWVDGIEYRADEAYLTDDRDILPLRSVEWPTGKCAEDYFSNGWRPSIHMPRWASRITLEVKRRWVERVQEIGDADADAELFGGDIPCNIDGPHQSVCKRHYVHDGGGYECECGGYSIKELFAIVWDSINASRGYGWDTNPWVWCVEFERVEGEE